MKRIALILAAVIVIAGGLYIFMNQQVSATEQPVTTPDTKVAFETSQGTIIMKLYPDVAPKTVENFVGLVKKGYYDGTVFHRVIKDFMIQGGDPTATGRGGQSLWGGKFEDEFSPKVSFDKPGLLAMANAGPNTNGSQFFITTVPCTWLNNKHTIFGEVVSGYDVVQKIDNCNTAWGDKPVVDQKIIKAYVVK